MIWGIFAGLTWGMETVLISMAMTLPPFIVNAVSAAPFICTFIHDLLSAILLFVFHFYKKEIKSIFLIVKSKSFKWFVISATIGGPIGMTGYVMAVKYLGASIGAITCAIYPAIGSIFAVVFLKEKLSFSRFVFLVLTLLGVLALNYNDTIQLENTFWGIIGALMCSFGWGLEAIILAKFIKDQAINPSHILQIRQTISALIYGIIILPITSKYQIVFNVFSASSSKTAILIISASIFATISYLSYYNAISKIGATKSMALNISYTAWSVIFSIFIFKNSGQFNIQSILFSIIIVVCGILSTVDFKKKF